MCTCQPRFVAISLRALAVWRPDSCTPPTPSNSGKSPDDCRRWQAERRHHPHLLTIAQIPIKRLGQAIVRWSAIYALGLPRRFLPGHGHSLPRYIFVPFRKRSGRAGIEIPCPQRAFESLPPVAFESAGSFNTIPSELCVMISNVPFSAETMTGKPQAIASAGGKAKVSSSDGPV